MNSDLFALHDKVVVVTGGYGHLGKAMTIALSNAGATVIVAARNQKKFEAQFKGKKGNFYFEEFDIAKHAAYTNLFNQIKNKFGRIDALVNNAFSILNDGNQETQTPEIFQKSLDTLLSTVYSSMQAIIPLFREQGGGRIVNIASMYGLVAPDFSIYKTVPGFVSLPNYGAAKAAIIHITKYYASLFGRDQVLVNSISPGPFPSPQVADYFEFTEELNKRSVLGRIGKPEEIGGSVVFLCSAASSYITGHNLIVDGGWTIR